MLIGYPGNVGGGPSAECVECRVGETSCGRQVRNSCMRKPHFKGTLVTCFGNVAIQGQFGYLLLLQVMGGVKIITNFKCQISN